MRRADALHHLHMGGAAPDVHRQIHHVRQQRQHPVPQLVLVQAHTTRAHAHAASFQCLQYAFRGDGVVARDLEVPDESAAHRQQQRQHQHRRQQHIPVPAPPPQLRRAGLSAHGHLCADVRRHLGQAPRAGQGGGHAEGCLRQPSQVPERNAVGGAQVHHALRRGTDHLSHRLTAEIIHCFTVHGDPPYSTRSIPDIFPVIRSSCSVITSSCRSWPRTRTTTPPPLTSTASVV